VANLQRNNHYLPACYQRGFADSEGKVWVKEASGTLLHRNPKTVGLLRNFYIRRTKGVENDAIEKFFGAAVEDGFAIFSQKVREDQHKAKITGADLAYVAQFVATQIVRTVAHKECIDEQAGTSVERDARLFIMLRQALTLVDEWSKDLPSFHFYTALPGLTHRFITGDDPIRGREHAEVAPVETPCSAFAPSDRHQAIPLTQAQRPPPRLGL
jgi:hypothetical protein